MKNRFNPLKAIFAVLLCLTMIIPVLPATTAYADGPALGTNVVPNGDFETQTLGETGWSYDPANFWIYDGTSGGFTKYAVLRDGDDTAGQASLVIPDVLPASEYTHADTGCLLVTYSMSTFQSSPSGSMQLRFIDGEGHDISGSNPISPESGTFSTASDKCPVPRGTRGVVVFLQNTPHTTGSNMMAVDNIDITFGLNPDPLSIYDRMPSLGEEFIIPEANITIDFNRDVQAVAGKYIHVREVGGATADIAVDDTSRVTITHNEVVINPDGDFTKNKDYIVYLDAGAFEDYMGNYSEEILSGVWKFYTNQCKVTFDLNDGSSPPPPVLVDCKFPVDKPADPRRTGFVFNGWYTDPTAGDLWNFADIVEDDLLLYAHWTADSTAPSINDRMPAPGGRFREIHMHVFIYFDEVVEGVSGKYIHITKVGGSTVDIEASSPNVVITGGTDVNIDPATTFEKNQDYYITLDAGAFRDMAYNNCAAISDPTDWTFDTDQCRVTFDPCDGDSAWDALVDCKNPVPEPDPEPTRAGYTLGGWYTNTDYAPEHQWDFSAEVDDDMKLYAKWDGAVSYTIRTSKTGSGTVTPANTYIIGSTATVIATPAKGYGFTHWRNGKTVVSSDSTYEFTVTGSITLTADFVKLGTPKFTAVASTGYDSIDLTWKAVTGATSYQIDRRIGKGPWGTIVPSTILLTYTDTGLTCGLTYTYRVRALYDIDKLTSNKGSWSSTKSAIPGTKVTVISSSSSRGKVEGDGYYVLGTSALVTATPKKGCYFVNWVSGGSVVSTDYKYGFTVTGPVKIKGVFAKIGTPSLKSAVSAGYDSITITWAPAAGASGYEIYRREGSSGSYIPYKDFVPGPKTLAGSLLTFTDTGLTCGTKYYYKVQAYSITGGTTTTGSFSSVKYAVPVPSKPTGLNAYAISATSIGLNWSAVDGAAHYQIFRSDKPKGTYTLQKGEPADTSFTQDSLITGHTYYYKVRAVYVSGGTTVYGELSDYAFVIPVEIPV